MRCNPQKVEKISHGRFLPSVLNFMLMLLHFFSQHFAPFAKNWKVSAPMACAALAQSLGVAANPLPPPITLQALCAPLGDPQHRL
jgi:hypothetical protein